MEGFDIEIGVDTTKDIAQSIADDINMDQNVDSAILGQPLDLLIPIAIGVSVNLISQFLVKAPTATRKFAAKLRKFKERGDKDSTSEPIIKIIVDGRPIKIDMSTEDTVINSLHSVRDLICKKPDIP